MKKLFDLHETIKEAVKEALLEVLDQMYGVATLEAPEAPEAPAEDGEGDGPKLDPIWGPAGFSLRKG